MAPRQHLKITLLTLLTLLLSPFSALAGESTMPPGFEEEIKPELAAKYTYTQDGVYRKELNMPSYEWMPAEGQPKAIVLGIHGLTLHGRRFRVLARSLAINGVGFISTDMRGFGRLHFDDYKQFSTPDDDKSLIAPEKSYEDLVALAKSIKAKYPEQKLIALGESLGCTFCVRLASEHPELISGIILSAPAVKVNKDMYMGKGQIKQGLKSLVVPDHEMNLTGFFADLCSQRPEVQKEMLDDPLILKKITLKRLIATDLFVDKTVDWAKKTDPNLKVLILQGSNDGCVAAKHVTDLMNVMRSDAQELAWRGNFGHLQLETVYMRGPVIDAIANWLSQQRPEYKQKCDALIQTIDGLGGRCQ